MASLKADKPVGSQPTGPVKKEPAKAPGSKQAPAPKKPELKPREPKKKASGGKPAPKN